MFKESDAFLLDCVVLFVVLISPNQGVMVIVP